LNQRRTDLAVGFGGNRQHAIDAEANLQIAFLRFDMNVRRVHLQGVFEQGLQQPHNGRFFCRLSGRQGAEIDDIVAEFVGQVTRQLADFFSAAIDPVDELQQRTFVRHRQFDFAIQVVDDFVEGEQVGRIGHRHQNPVFALFEHNGAETASQLFRQKAHNLGPDMHLAQVEIGNLQLACNRAGDFILGDETMLDQYAAKFASGLLLFRERFHELLLRNQLLLYQKIAKTDLLWPRHMRSPVLNLSVN